MLNHVTSATTRLPTPEGPGSVFGAPNREARLGRFVETFSQSYRRVMRASLPYARATAFR